MRAPHTPMQIPCAEQFLSIPLPYTTKELMSLSLLAHEVPPQEVATLVLHYLREHEFHASAQQFAAEADGLEGGVPPASKTGQRGL